jgi:uncharacterized membrane protein
MAYSRRRQQPVGGGQPPAHTDSTGLLHRGVQVLAVLGLGISAYLTYLHYSKSIAALCTEGSGCNIVRSSSYSAILSIPVAMLGLVGFAVILGISFSKLSPFRKGLSLYLLALAGVTFSAFLTYLAVAVINVLCLYCLISSSLMVGILVLHLLRHPLVPSLSTDDLKWYRSLVAVAGAVAVVGSMMAYRGADMVEGEAAIFQIALAQHLTAENAAMYGAYWCPHCANQKKLFGAPSSTSPTWSATPRVKRPTLLSASRKG